MAYQYGYGQRGSVPDDHQHMCHRRRSTLPTYFSRGENELNQGRPPICALSWQVTKNREDILPTLGACARSRRKTYLICATYRIIGDNNMTHKRKEGDKGGRKMAITTRCWAATRAYSAPRSRSYALFDEDMNCMKGNAIISLQRLAPHVAYRIQRALAPNAARASLFHSNSARAAAQNSNNRKRQTRREGVARVKQRSSNALRGTVDALCVYVRVSGITRASLLFLATFS